MTMFVWRDVTDDSWGADMLCVLASSVAEARKLAHEEIDRELLESYARERETAHKRIDGMEPETPCAAFMRYAE